MKSKLINILFLFHVAYSEGIEKTTLFSHGITDNWTQVNRFKEAISTTQVETIDYPDSLAPSSYNILSHIIFGITSYLGKNMNRDAMFMGQKGDIATLNSKITDLKDKEVILFGSSRGAATILSCLGQHNPENIAAIVLDACPASMPEASQMFLAKTGINPDYYNRVFPIVFPYYDTATALTPLDAINKVTNKNIPILLLHSLEDKTVSYTDSLRLYNNFIKQGFVNAHLALISKGRHSFLLQNTDVKTEYLTAVHSFYKKYNLPYNKEYAQDNIQKINFSTEDIENHIQKYKNSITECYDYSYKRNIAFLITTLLITGIYNFK